MAVPVHNICVCICLCVRVHVFVCVYVCVCACVYACLCICVCMCVYAYVHVCVCVRVHVCVCIESFPMLQCKWCPYIAPISSREHYWEALHIVAVKLLLTYHYRLWQDWGMESLHKTSS